MKYESIAYLQFDQDTRILEKFFDEGMEEEILREVREYNFGQEGTIRDKLLNYSGDSVVAQDDFYTVIRNAHVGGTWEILRNRKEDQWKQE